MPAVVDLELCQGCEDCVDACPVECLEIVEGKARVNVEDCTDCSACVEACPEDAISMED